MAIETGAGGIVYYALVKFTARAIGIGVFHEDIVVALLVAINKIEATGIKVAVFPLHTHYNIIAHMVGPKSDGAKAKSRAFQHGNLQVG